MDILRYKQVTLPAGSVSVSSGGVNLSQILKVARQGIQHDYIGLVGINSANRAWSFVSHTKRVIFSTSFPALEDETIFIIYKEST